MALARLQRLLAGDPHVRAVLRFGPADQLDRAVLPPLHLQWAEALPLRQLRYRLAILGLLQVLDRVGLATQEALPTPCLRQRVDVTQRV